MNDRNEEGQEMTESDSTVQVKTSVNQSQYGIAALFWVTFAIGIGIAYLQQLDDVQVVLAGLLSLVIGLAIGALIGKISGQMSDSFFWGTLIAAFGYISVASDPIYSTGLRLAWAFVGALSGAIAGSLLCKQPPKPLIATAIIAAGLSAIVMFAYTFIGRVTLDAKLDLIGAPIVGVLVTLFVKLLLWVEARYKTARYITATWLLAVVVIGNLLAR